MHLLVVEDEPRLAQFIKRGLTEESHVVDTVRDGEEAIERTTRTAYDLVILDLMLPGMDGFAVCRALRAAAGIEVYA
jgi:DNA-binding response OmpR family regulator